MTADLRNGSRDHHHVGCALVDLVIARRALVGLRRLKRLEHTDVEIGIGPRPNTRDQVGDVARGIVVIRW